MRSPSLSVWDTCSDLAWYLKGLKVPYPIKGMDLYSTHGLKEEWNFAEIKQIRIMEEDPGLDDHMGKWNDITFPANKIKDLYPGSSTNGKDATIKVVWYGYDD